MSQHAAQENHRPRVVVLGGGFGGMAAVKHLRNADVDVLLIDRRSYTTFQPLLYQVATGGLNPGDVTFALRAFTSRYDNADFLRATVTGVDTDAQQVQLEGLDPVPYDFLVVSVGVTANFFGIEGAQENARPIYTRQDAITVRDRIFTSIENAAQARSGKRETSVVVVGGGPTGVEMAGALAELRNGAVPVAFRTLGIDQVHIVLVEMLDHVLSPFAPNLQEYAARELRERGVDVRLGTSVQQVTPDAVVVKRPDGEQETIPSVMTVWATGITAGPVVGSWGLPTGKGGAIEVQPDLSVKGLPNVFAAGDVAGAGLPQVAQPAIQGGKHAAQQIKHLLAGEPTTKFSYFDKGTMATIGRSDAVVQLPVGVKLRGSIGWLSWLGLHLIELMGGRNRVAAMVNLATRYYSWPRSVNVVVGDPAE
ncbi:NAD(P)/FAD-dependent oxidoreductase [Luteipulveratus sp. YIM 133132]|uniref:NAD(P)/FAD-dependent oxidoreductase n=1 Tax=Luteipulveratus flavus TaxID=3031728 RepID=UPI0023B169B0|nr:NAD(P)/FAD-dependent oxidoreductase [Luteipulveratus sp. YIM 133132]MDE9364731.1 NAD(P)/FAD-dependent oxidoreductase [Luteipulveratus sp. YIM 133132]